MKFILLEQDHYHTDNSMILIVLKNSCKYKQFSAAK